MKRPPDSDGAFREDVLSGLRGRPRSIPCKYFYDEDGSELFDRICGLEAYYPTRTEIGVLEAAGSEIAEEIGPGAEIIEYGSGAGVKTRLLLSVLDAPRSYMPVEICEPALVKAVAVLRPLFPEIEIRPICADYTEEFDVPTEAGTKRVVFFPGSTIGNFTPVEARAFLERIGRQIGEEGGLLIGVDLVKSPTLLHRAYNDEQGVTAEFNKNLLSRINRELGADFDLEQFAHYAPYNPLEKRIEAYLISRCQQTVRVCGEEFSFGKGEPIHTENSYKYTIAGFRRLAGEAGLEAKRVWTDPDDLFSLFYFKKSA